MLFDGRQPGRRATAILRLSRTFFYCPAKNLPPTRFRRLLISLLRCRLLSRGSSFDAMRNVIVTGGSRGLGLGIASKLAKEGYRAIAIARNKTPELKALIQPSAEPGCESGCVQFVPFDLANLEGI